MGIKRRYFWDWGTFVVELTPEEWLNDYITNYSAYTSWVSPASHNVFITPL